MTFQGGSRQIVIHGMLLVLVGLVWGLAVPWTPHPRLALGAHMQFVTNGMLFIVLATAMLTFPHAAGRTTVRGVVVAAWLTWAMALSEVANSWWGTTRMLPLAARQAGATGGEPWQELVVTLTHIGSGLGLIIAWGLVLAGFLRRASGTDKE